MSDLATWLLEQIADDEAAYRVEQAGIEWLSVNGRNLWDHLLAECEAKRAIVERHVSSEAARGVGQHRDGKWTPYCEFDHETWPCPDARDIARPYADRPGFREEWR